MVDLYVKLVQKGLRTLEQVPASIRAAVTEKLEENK
jgi:hypothetical protein